MRHLLIVLFLLLPGLASAQSVQEQIVSQLTAQGFTRIEISRTLLGRVKIEARSPSLDRELVFNPATGEILRDYWQNRSDGSAAPRVLIPDAHSDDDRRTAASTSGGNSGSGRGGSGASGSNSGSGSSSSGRGSDDRADDDRSGNSGSGSDRSGRDDGTDRDDDKGRGRGRGGDDREDD